MSPKPEAQAARTKLFLPSRPAAMAIAVFGLAALGIALKVGADSLLVLRRNVSVLPIAPGVLAKGYRLSGSTLFLTTTEAFDLRLRAYDLAGNRQASVLRRVPAGATALPLEEAFREARLGAGLHIVELSAPALGGSLRRAWLRD